MEIWGKFHLFQEKWIFGENGPQNLSKTLWITVVFSMPAKRGPVLRKFWISSNSWNFMKFCEFWGISKKFWEFCKILIFVILERVFEALRVWIEKVRSDRSLLSPQTLSVTDIIQGKGGGRGGSILLSSLSDSLLFSKNEHHQSNVLYGAEIRS